MKKKQSEGLNLHLRIPPGAMADWIREQAKRRGYSPQMIIRLCIESEISGSIVRGRK